MKIWIYRDGRQQGPFDLYNPGDISIDSTAPVWYEGLDRWKPAGLCPELKEFLSSSADSTKTDDSPSAENSAQSDKAQSPQPAPAPAPEIGRPAPPVASAAASAECPPTYIGWSIFLTICCCSPLSIGALIASICVVTAWNSGRHSNARKASQWAAWLIMTAIALGFLPMMLMGVFMPG